MRSGVEEAREYAERMGMSPLDLLARDVVEDGFAGLVI
jgi:hypothetical protein